MAHGSMRPKSIATWDETATPKYIQSMTAKEDAMQVKWVNLFHTRVGGITLLLLITVGPEASY